MSKAISARSVGAVWRGTQEAALASAGGALLRAALRAEVIVAQDTPADTGEARAAWRVEVGSPTEPARLVNDAPHIGVLEVGARPHRPPLMPILRWLVRKIGADGKGGRRTFTVLSEVDGDVVARARAVQAKIARDGSPAYGMVAKNLDKLSRIARDEVEAAIKRSRPGAAGGGA